MSDEELFMFLVNAVLILERHRQLRLRRLCYSAYLMQTLRNLQLQRAALQNFIGLYQSRQAWAFNRESSEFQSHYDAALNLGRNQDPQYWLSTFRVSKETFDYLCAIVHDYIVKEESNMRETIPVPKRVAVSLHWLAHGGSYWSNGQKFGISSSIVGRITKDFIAALLSLKYNYIIWPNKSDDFFDLISSFKDKSPLPNIFGAIGTTHVQIIAPENNTCRYLDRKLNYSIACQGICDGKMKFLSISAGFPGSLKTKEIIKDSWLYMEARKWNMLREPVLELGKNLAGKPCLAGDATYPVLDWLLTPFPVSAALDPAQEAFNQALSKTAIQIKRAFELLKGRWRLLNGKVNLEPSFAADTITACAVLHNICQERDEPGENVLDFYIEVDCNDVGCGIEGNESSETRDLLVKYLESMGKI